MTGKYIFIFPMNIFSMAARQKSNKTGTEAKLFIMTVGIVLCFCYFSCFAVSYLYLNYERTKIYNMYHKNSIQLLSRTWWTLALMMHTPLTSHHPHTHPPTPPPPHPTLPDEMAAKLHMKSLRNLYIFDIFYYMKPSLILMMAWRRTVDKPLSKPMMTQFNDASYELV